MTKSFTLIITVLITMVTISWAFLAGLSKDQWLVTFQSLGTVLALLWIIFTGMLQERTGNRDVVLQSLDIIKANLEDLSKSIEIEIGKLGKNTGDYEKRYHRGERTSYMVPLTADNGRRLRRLYSSEIVRTPELERRLKTYVSMFEPILTMSASDPEFRRVIETSSYGRSYLAIKAALAESENDAQAFIGKLTQHDTGSVQ